MSLFQAFIPLPDPVYLAQWDGKPATLTAFQSYLSGLATTFPAMPVITVAQDGSGNLVFSWRDPHLRQVTATIPNGSWLTVLQPDAHGSWDVKALDDTERLGYFRAAAGFPIPPNSGGPTPP